jgi:hypothetical protein
VAREKIEAPRGAASGEGARRLGRRAVLGCADAEASGAQARRCRRGAGARRRGAAGALAETVSH